MITTWDVPRQSLATGSKVTVEPCPTKHAASRLISMIAQCECWLMLVSANVIPRVILPLFFAPLSLGSHEVDVLLASRL